MIRLDSTNPPDSTETILRPAWAPAWMAAFMLACASIVGLKIAALLPAQGAIILFMVWLLGSVFFLCTFISQAWSRTVVHRRADILTVKKSLGSWQWSEPRSFSLAAIGDLSVERHVSRRRAGRGVLYTLTFVESGKKRELLGSLSREQLQQLLDGPLRGIVPDPSDPVPRAISGRQQLLVLLVFAAVTIVAQTLLFGGESNSWIEAVLKNPFLWPLYYAVSALIIKLLSGKR